MAAKYYSLPAAVTTLPDNAKMHTYIPSNLMPPGYMRKPEDAPLVVYGGGQHRTAYQPAAYQSALVPAPPAPATFLVDTEKTARQIADMLAPQAIAQARAESHAATAAASVEAAWRDYNARAAAEYDAAERKRLEETALENVRNRNKANELEIMEREARLRLKKEMSRSLSSHRSRSRSRRRRSGEKERVVVVEHRSRIESDCGCSEEAEPRPLLLTINNADGRGSRYYESRGRRRNSVAYMRDY